MHAVHGLADRVRESSALKALFVENEGLALFEAADGSEEGRAFLEEYHAFVSVHGHSFSGQRAYRKSLEADDHAEALIAPTATEQEFNTLVRLIVSGDDDSLPVRTRSSPVTNRLWSPLDCQRIIRERREWITGCSYPLAMRAHMDRDAVDELDDKTEHYLVKGARRAVAFHQTRGEQLRQMQRRRRIFAAISNAR